MATDTRTTELGIETPDPANTIAEDLARVALGLERIDTFLKTNIDAISGKADSGHQHTVDDVAGLQNALGTLAQSITDLPASLGALSDTDTGDATQGMMLQYLAGKWQAVVARAEHLGVSEINGLDANNVQEALAELLARTGTLDVEKISQGQVPGIQAKLEAGLQPGRSQPFIDPQFDIWPEGESFLTTGGQYTASMWRKDDTGSSVVQVTRVASTLAEQDYMLRYAVTTADAGQHGFLAQRFHDVRNDAGSQYTLFVQGAADSLPRSFDVVVRQVFGDGGSAYVETEVGAILVPDSIGWSRLLFTVPPIDGATVGANSYTQIALRSDAGETHAVLFAKIFARQGDWTGENESTAFRPLGRDLEKLRLLEFLYQMADRNFIASGYGVSTNDFYLGVTFPIEMVRVPDISVTESISARCDPPFFASTFITTKGCYAGFNINSDGPAHWAGSLTADARP